MRSHRLTIVGAASLFAATLGLGGCVVIVDSDHGYRTDWPRYDEIRSFTIAYDAAAPITVSTDRGSILVRKADVTDIEVTARVYARSAARAEDIGVHAERSPDGVVIVEPQWPHYNRRSGDAVSFEIVVPDAVGVNAYSGDGAITIEGLAGDLEANTDDGPITVQGHDGSVHAESGDGAITLTDIVGDVWARSGDGAIKALGVAGVVDLATEDGVIVADLTSDSPGPVRIHTEDGGVSLHVGTAFMGRLALQSDDGRIDVRGLKTRPDASLETLSRNLVVLHFAGDEPRSLVTTEDGAIRLDVDQRSADDAAN